MNTKRLVISLLAVFAFIFLSDMLIHGGILESAYKSTASLWRPEAEMQSYMVWMFMAQFLMSLAFVLIFPFGYQGKGWTEGIRFGFYVGLICASNVLIQYAVTPLTMNIALAWIAAGFFQAMCVGVICATLQRKLA